MIFTSRWVLPIDRAPLSPGWIEVSGTSIVAVGAGRPPAGAHDLGDVAVLPGLVNAHTHLELSWMAGLVRPAPAMHQWIRALLRTRIAGAPGGAQGEARAVRNAIASMAATGTVLVGDVSNTLVTVEALREAGMGGIVFHELLGFDVDDPVSLVTQAEERLAAVIATGGHVDSAESDAPRLDGRVVAHAPYSTSPALFSEIARREHVMPLAVHLGESPEEVDLLRTGEGPLKSLLQDLGVWTGSWSAPACEPVEYMRRVGYLQPGMLAVHATHLTDDGLERLREAEAVLVTCPRSNVWVGVGLPRVSHFYASGVPVAIGTDSLASVSTLNLFDELAELRRIAPDMAAGALLDSATRVGAAALGFERTHGTISPGKRAALIAVDVPAGVNDVEEYLVSGVPADAVRRVS